ncbi:hypothetical protein [Actibacterium sp. 188UL27-1]|uniref:hypothetical protein n=1 Tax=Actibacterium sp. 188UL27-1 TaxID=2786961 RepID=UPI00195E9235|nr:hypothetical protein [Actibacterium sp. 188UL27-1]MBM7069724.1 hypothetical protein [Actibacterium sp. 188UL27-1]
MPASFRDYIWSSGLRDIDGSITGTVGATLTPIMTVDFAGSEINKAGVSTRHDDWGAWVVTDPEIDLGWLHVRPINQNASTHDGTYDLIRSDGEQVLGQVATFDKFPNPNVVLCEDHSYRFRFHDLPSTRGFDAAMTGMERGERVVYTFEDMPRGATISDATARNSTGPIARPISGVAMIWLLNLWPTPRTASCPIRMIRKC